MKQVKKHAICIQCHNKPEQINYLINKLYKNHFDFYIHIDKKSCIQGELIHAENVFFVPKCDVRWGQFSQVEATLSLFGAIDYSKYNYVHLISGNDYLIKSEEYFLNFFDKNQGNEFIESNELGMGKCTWTWGGEERFLLYYPQWMIQRPSRKLYHVIRVAYREFVMRTGIFKRKNLPVRTFYGGSSWFSLTSECVCWMMDYIDKHIEYKDFFRHGLCSDEIFFSTLVRQGPFADRIVNENLRYMDWMNTDKNGGPKVLTVDDISSMGHSNDVFARKFASIDVIKQVDKILCGEKS